MSPTPVNPAQPVNLDGELSCHAAMMTGYGSAARTQN
jgi:hypothetical protein